MNSFVARLFLTALAIVTVGCGGTKELAPSTEPVNRPPEDAMQKAMKESMDKGGNRPGAELPKTVPGA